jgi:aspartate/methionine/tyrosine aminotransferase
MAMYITLEAILNDGDEVVVLAPYFTCYSEQIRLARGVTVECETRFEENFQVNTARLEACITERTRAIIVNTPCNPTGNCLSRESLEEIAAIAKKHDLIVIADDIYTIFSYQETFLPIASLPGMRDRTITISSFSKNFLMTGWRLGYIVAPDYLITAMAGINENIIYSAPTISQWAGVYALQNRHTICPPIAEEYRRRLNYAADRINAIPKMHVLTPPGGTFYLFVDVRDTGLTSVEVSRIILEEAHVLTLPGIGFGCCGEGFLRLACTLGEEKMKEAFDRIEKVSIFQE